MMLNAVLNAQWAAAVPSRIRALEAGARVGVTEWLGARGNRSRGSIRSEMRPRGMAGVLIIEYAA